MTGAETTAFKAVEGAKPYPPNFRARKVAANGVPLYVRVGGAGRAVVLLHGYGETALEAIDNLRLSSAFLFRFSQAPKTVFAAWLFRMMSA